MFQWYRKLRAKYSSCKNRWRHDWGVPNDWNPWTPRIGTIITCKFCGKKRELIGYEQFDSDMSAWCKWKDING